MTNPESSSMHTLRIVLEHLNQMVSDSSGSRHVPIPELTRNINKYTAPLRLSRDEVYRALIALRTFGLTQFLWDPHLNDSIIMRGDTADVSDFDRYIQQNPARARYVLTR